MTVIMVSEKDGLELLPSDMIQTCAVDQYAWSGKDNTVTQFVDTTVMLTERSNTVFFFQNYSCSMPLRQDQRGGPVRAV